MLEPLEDRLTPAVTVASPMISLGQQATIFSQAASMLSSEVAALMQFERAILGQFVALQTVFAAEVMAIDQAFLAMAGRGFTAMPSSPSDMMLMMSMMPMMHRR
jgi:hypothetical protein